MKNHWWQSFPPLNMLVPRVDDERSQAEDPERNVRPRLRERSVSPNCRRCSGGGFGGQRSGTRGNPFVRVILDADEDRFVPRDVSPCRFQHQPRGERHRNHDSSADSEFGGGGIAGRRFIFVEDDVHMAPPSPANLRAA